MSNSKAYSLEAKKKHTFGEMGNCKLFVRKLTQPEKFNEEN